MVPMLSASVYLISKQILAHCGVLPVHCNSVNAVPSSQRSSQVAVWSCSKMHVGRSGTHLQFVQPGCPVEQRPPRKREKSFVEVPREAHFKRAPIPTSLLRSSCYFLRRGAKNSKSENRFPLKAPLEFKTHSKKMFFLFSFFLHSRQK
jgi:hypothetical protein